MSIATAPHARPLPSPIGLGIAARNLRVFKFLLPFIILVGIWWAVELAGNFPDRILVSPARVWDTLIVLSEHGILAEYISTSLSMVGFATLISLAIGVPVGFVVGSNRYAARSLEGFLRFLQGVSGIAWLPLNHLVWVYAHDDPSRCDLHFDRADHLQHHGRRARGARILCVGVTLAWRQPIAVDYQRLFAGCAPQHRGRRAAGMGYGWRA